VIDLFRGNRDFTNFFLAGFISRAGDGVQSLAILWLSYNLYRSSLVVGLVMIAVSLPGILASPYAGSLADRRDRIKIMVAADLVRMVCVFLLALFAWQGILGLAALMVLSAVMSVASSFFNPASLAFLPQVITRSDLTRANGLNQMSSNLTMVAGPLIGMSLIVTIGVATAFALNGISFLCSALLIRRINVHYHPQSDREPESAGTVPVILRDGFRLLGRYPIAARMLDKTAVINFFFASIPILIPLYAEEIYHSGARGIGWMMSSFGAGTLAASLLLATSLPGRYPVRITLTGALLIMGAAFMVFGLVMSWPVTLVTLLVIGFCVNFANIVLVSLYQRSLPNEVLGRIMAFMTAISMSLQPVSYGLTGALAEFAGLNRLLVISGLLIMASALTILRIRELRSS
jgi:MFS family permease